MYPVSSSVFVKSAVLTKHHDQTAREAPDSNTKGQSVTATHRKEFSSEMVLIS